MRFIHDLVFDAQVGNTEPELTRAPTARRSTARSQLG